MENRGQLRGSELKFSEVIHCNVPDDCVDWTDPILDFSRIKSLEFARLRRQHAENSGDGQQRETSLSAAAKSKSLRTNMATSNVTLFMYPGTCAIVPHILLAYVGIPFDIEPVRSTAMTSEFATINPKKQVPVLVFDGNTLTENPAIIHAINHLAPEKQITGKDTMQFLRVCEWMNWLSGSLHAQVWGAYARPWRWTGDPSAEAGIREKCKGRVIERLDMIESKLPDSGWSLGENFTAVDAYLFPFFRWGKGRMGLDMESKYPKWAKLVAKVEELKAVKAVVEKEDTMAGELKGQSDYSQIR